jgi:hypothetical protein
MSFGRSRGALSISSISTTARRGPSPRYSRGRYGSASAGCIISSDAMPRASKSTNFITGTSAPPKRDWRKWPSAS